MSVFLVNAIDEVATLDVVVNDVVVTTFSYATGMVTLSERFNPVVMNLAEYNTRLTQIKKWLTIINGEIVPATTPRVKYREVVKKTNNKIKMDFQFDHPNGQIVTDAEYDWQTGMVTFQARAEITMAWTDFTYWIAFLSRCQAEASIF